MGKPATERTGHAEESGRELRYYNLADEVTIQCDASPSGLGAALMQNGQPVAYASRVLTPSETRYAQIKKELLASVFACDRFKAYIYGRDRVSIASDHKLLEMIVLKPLSSASKRLQRMLPQLQKYTLDVKYKKGVTHVTSSPHYAQSNGNSDNALKTLQLLFAKAKQSGESEYMALLDWRNTPSDGMSTSHAQRLLGRRCKTSLPTAGTLLKLRYDTDADTRALAGRKRRKSFYYNRHARPVTPIDEGATVRMRLPGERRGQLAKLPRGGWRDGLQTQSTTVGVCWRGAPP